MKNISLAINAVLLILIIALFFMYSSLKKSISGGGADTKTTEMPLLNASKQKGVRIAYVNADSINATYKLMKDLKNDLQTRQAALQSEYETKGRKLQTEYAEYQQKAQSGNISQLDAEKAQKDMEAKKADLDNVQHRIDDLIKSAQQQDVALNEKVQNYITLYNKKAHFDYVLGYTNVGGTVLFANDSLDITKDIVTALNKMYEDSIQKAGGKH